MAKLICKECGKTFEFKKESACKVSLNAHLKKEHKMTILDYIVKHEYNGIRPLCPCGCGKELNLKEGGKRWSFNKYYSDTCYGKLVKSANQEINKQVDEMNKNKFDVVKYYEQHYDRNTYEKAFQLFKSKEFSLANVANSFNIDTRTLKKVWLAMEITTPEELTVLLEYTKYKLSSINNSNNTLNNEDMLSWMYALIKSHPGKYTIHSLIKEYNHNNQNNPCKQLDSSVLKALYKIYGDEIDILLAVGYHSSEEYEFFNVLKFYIPEYIIKIGKKFVLKDDYIYFDFIIGSKLLIEYDSDGKFHQEDAIKAHDLDKENFAKENGYKFLRLTKKEAHDLNTITTIKKLLENEIN